MEVKGRPTYEPAQNGGNFFHHHHPRRSRAGGNLDRKKLCLGAKFLRPRRGRARMEVKGRPTYEPAQNGGKWPKMAEIFSTTLRVRS